MDICIEGPVDTTARAMGSEQLEHVGNGKPFSEGLVVWSCTHSVTGPGDGVTVALAVDMRTETLLSGGAFQRTEI